MSNQSKSVVILGTGSYAPERVVTNDEIAEIVDTSDEWIRTRTGIEKRHFAAKDENTSDMACRAAEHAIAAAQIAREEIDLIIVATMTPDMPFPSTSCLLQSKLKLPEVTAFDIQAACSGFTYALSIANSMLLSGNFKKALVVGSEKMSSILDFQDRSTCVLFGDGAGAAILALQDTSEKAGILRTICGADGSNPKILQQPGGGSALPPSPESLENRQHFLKMNGKEVFKSAVRVMGQVSIEILKQQGYTPEEIDLVIPHQANIRIIDKLAKQLDIPIEKFHNNLVRYGNTSAASIPIALDEAIRTSRLKSGNLVLLVAFGAGLTWSATLLRWQ